MMNVMVPRRHNNPFQRSIAPPNIQMHEVILSYVLEDNRPEHPPRRDAEKHSGRYIGQVNQRMLDDRASDARKPIHICGR